MSKPLIPFSWLPTSWGLRGKSLDVARAYYELEGYELDIRLAEIHNTDSKDLTKAIADINFSWGVIDEYTRCREHILVDTKDDIEQQIELIKLDIEFKKIEKRDGEKQIAAILEEPWVAIIDEGLDPEGGPNGFYFVFDWNDHWIAMLRQHGYEGATDEDLMERWFTDVCRTEVINSNPVPFGSGIIYD